jgi:predicted TIM-barrel fold metal-dependent hydrolase
VSRGQAEPASSGPSSPPAPIVDTHAHIYAPDERRYPPIPEPRRPPDGTGSLDRLREVSRANGVTAVCAIQTSTFYRFDNRYILDSAGAEPGWLAGVCTLDPDDPGSPAMLERAVRDHGIRGMRSIPAADGRLDHPGVRALWAAATDLGIVINLLIDPDLAGQAERLLGRFPSLRVVLDHGLNLRVGRGLEPTLGILRRLSAREHTYAKLSFVPTGSATGYPCADMLDPCLRVIDAFGPDRCVWGSDFPVELWAPRITYAEHLRIFTEDLPLEPAARAAILGGTALRLWFPSVAGQSSSSR